MIAVNLRVIAVGYGIAERDDGTRLARRFNVYFVKKNREVDVCGDGIAVLAVKSPLSEI